QVYIDANGDFQFDAGDPAALTDAAGNYTLSGLAPGRYIVQVALPAGWVGSYGFQDVTLLSGQSLTVPPIGIAQTGSISGQAFEDINGDGVRQAAEPP